MSAASMHVSHPSPTWERVFAFSIEMEGKLALNRHKGDWRGDNPADLLYRLGEEVVELAQSMGLWFKFEMSDEDPLVENARPKAEIIGEAADVANFAMMIADIASLRSE